MTSTSQMYQKRLFSSAQVDDDLKKLQVLNDKKLVTFNKTTKTPSISACVKKNVIRAKVFSTISQ